MIRKKNKKSRLVFATAIVAGSIITGASVMSPVFAYANEDGTTQNESADVFNDDVVENESNVIHTDDNEDKSDNLTGSDETDDNKDDTDISAKETADDPDDKADSISQDKEKSPGGGGGGSVDAYFSAKIVDSEGNVIDNATVDVTYFTESYEEKKETLGKKGSQETPFVHGYDSFKINNLVLPEGYTQPNYDGTQTAIFSDGLSLNYDPDSDKFVLESTTAGYSFSEHVTITETEGAQKGTHSYTATIEVSGEGVTYYNEIGGNKAGEDDPGYDAIYTIGSGNPVTLIFKRNIKDEETFSHFEGLYREDGSKGGAVLTRDVDYFASQGSVKVALTSKYLDSLGVGEHIFYAHFDDDISEIKKSVMAKIKIVAPSEPEVATQNTTPAQSAGATTTTTTAAPTGNKDNTAIWGVGSGAVVITISGIVLGRNRKKSKK